MWTLKIYWTDVMSKTELRALRFHWVVPGRINYDISPVGRFWLKGNFGKGLKWGNVGTQGVVQTRKQSWQQLVDRQEHERRRDLHFCVPF